MSFIIIKWDTQWHEETTFSVCSVFLFNKAQWATWSEKAPSRGDDASQQQLVDFYKTHCTQRE